MKSSATLLASNDRPRGFNIEAAYIIFTIGEEKKGKSKFFCWWEEKEKEEN
jgi:hypothetical protein